MTVSTPGYVIDTNVIIDGHHKYDLKSKYPHLWNAIAILINQHRLVCPREVLTELQRGDDGLYECTKSAGVVVEPGDECTSIVDEITGRFTNWVCKNKNHADPWVIGEAEWRGFTVVTQEKHMIPKVCKNRGVHCTNFEGMMKAEGLSF